MPMTKEELKIVIEEGEGYRIEFKEKLSDLDREMVSFANASGGRIFLGIADEGRINGITVNNILKSRIQGEGKVRYDELIKRDFKDKDIDREKIDRFLKMAGISKVLDKPLLYKNLGIGEIQEGRVFYNNLAPLFFAKNLNDFYYHTVVTCALYRGREKAVVLDRKDYNSDLVSNVDMSMNFISQYLPVRYEFTGELARKEIPQVQYEFMPFFVKAVFPRPEEVTEIASHVTPKDGTKLALSRAQVEAHVHLSALPSCMQRFA